MIFAATVSVFFAAVTVLVFVAWKRSSPKRKNRGQAQGDGSTCYDFVTISAQLVPHIDALDLQDEATILVWGWDSHYFSSGKRSKFSCKALERWLSRGATITYVFASPNSTVPAALDALAESSAGKLKVHRISMNELDDVGQRIALRFKSLHPTLINLGGNRGKAMWVEYNHPEGSSVAYDVQFYSPQALNSSMALAEFAAYERQISHVLPTQEDSTQAA